MTSNTVQQLNGATKLHSYREPSNLFIIKGFWFVGLMLVIICWICSFEISLLFLVIVPVYMIPLMVVESKVMNTGYPMPNNGLTHAGQLVKDLVLNTFSSKKNLIICILYFILFVFSLIFKAEILAGSFIFMNIVIPFMYSVYKAFNSVRIYLLTH